MIFFLLSFILLFEDLPPCEISLDDRFIFAVHPVSAQISIGGVTAILVVFLSLVIFLWYLGRSLRPRKSSFVQHTEDKPAVLTSVDPPIALPPSQEQLTELYHLMKVNSPLFLTKFCTYYPSYIEKLNKLAFPELVSSELEICAYLKLNLDTKQISRYTNRSIRSIENRRYRIRKKLNLSPNTDLKNHLLNLD